MSLFRHSTVTLRVTETDAGVRVVASDQETAVYAQHAAATLEVAASGALRLLIEQRGLRAVG